MRISDWSSDVCSSDLRNRDVRTQAVNHQGEHQEHEPALQVAVSRSGFAQCLCISHVLPRNQASEPPAASMAARAPAVAVMPLSVTLRESSPDLMTLA